MLSMKMKEEFDFDLTFVVFAVGLGCSSSIKQ